MKRCRTNPLFAPLTLRELLYLSVFIHAKAVLGAYISSPRWGQATAVVDNVLYVSGGKTDQYGAYSYTSAPTTNDLFTLDLSNRFDPSTPPWNYISGSEDASSTQGPVLAWHTLAAYNASQLLLFGGDGGPNSRVTLPNGADSAQILDVSTSNRPTWIEQSQGWANQPSRRIHHTTSTVGGKVFLIGGEKDDGSSLGYSDHYVFDPSTPNFTRLPSTNGPPDIYGHASVPLSDGRLLVFGGYSQSESALVPFTTIWSLSAESGNYIWSIESVSESSVPSGRRAFAYTWLECDKVLIHGGTDAEFQTSYSDGWILDTTTNPMTWTNVSALTQIGPRRDHFAVQVGSQVLFGFGYGNSAGASVSLLIFNYDQAAFTSSFSPQSNPSLTTLPVPGGAGDSSSGGSGGSGSEGSSSGSNPNGGSTSHGSGGNSGDTFDPNNPGPNGGDGASGTGSGGDDHKKQVAVIVVASVFGLLAAALAAGVVIVFIIRRRRAQGRFHLLDNVDEHRPRPGASPPWEIAGVGILPWFKARRALARGEKTRVADAKRGWTVLGLGRPRERVDMLANEDASEFAAGHRRRPHQFGSGDSRSWYSAHDEADHERRESTNSIARIVSGPLNSLRNLGSGVRRVISGGNANSHGYARVRHPRQRTDISLPLDAYEDSERLLLYDKTHAWDPEEMDIALAARPRGGRKESSNASKYTDPFQDPGERDVLFDVSPSPATPKPPNASKATLGFSQDQQDEQAHSSQSTLSRSSDVPQLPPLVTTTSKSSPNEQSSFSFIDSGVAGHSSSSSSNHAALSVTSSTRPRTTSIINVSAPPTSPVKRSDSWWTRFKRPRSSSNRENSIDYGRQPFARLDLEFRDPNPPPVKLSAIKEASGGSTFAGDSPLSSQIGKAQREEKGGKLYLSSGHGQSTSSLRTSRTADSAALERLAWRMDVAFRETTGTSVDYASSVSEGRKRSQDREGTLSSLDDGATEYGYRYGHGIQRSSSPERGLDIADTDERRSRPLTTEAPSRSARPSSPPLAIPDAPSSTWGLTLKVKGKSPISPGTVASRVADYERRMSQEFTTSTSTPSLVISSPSPASPRTPRTPRPQSGALTPSPTSRTGGRRQNPNVKYGLVQRPELFVANPDSHRHSVSGSSDV